jgi:hypothetical protein
LEAGRDVRAVMAGDEQQRDEEAPTHNVIYQSYENV